MNERERWIIYPLLFFALGAALRDKFTHEVKTDQLRAGKILCEELVVFDSEKPDRAVAKLSSNPPLKNSPNADRYGVFVLIDSEGKELCGVTNNQLQVSRIACNVVSILDPQNPNRALALLTSAAGAKADGSARRLGSLIVTDSDGVEQFGLADDQLRMRQVVCEGVAVVNPGNPAEILAGLGSVPVEVEGQEGEEKKGGRIGVLELNHQALISLRGNPSERPLENQPREKSTPEPDGSTDQNSDAEETPAKRSPAPPAAETPESSTEIKDEKA
ncbi:hypothetical protein [Lacipirellula sp.]|uniref:hypothetical protein n=1 Tax=Lacipirellula sp. TaxID=2691419 RepID=UPI003D10CC74